MGKTLLIGKHEVVYWHEPQRVLERAQRMMPHIQAKLIPDDRHLFPVNQTDITNESMLAFLTG